MIGTQRLNVHALTARLFFHVPVMLAYMVHQLDAGGVKHPTTVAMSLLALYAAGSAVSDYASGVFADWAGRAWALILGSVIYSVAVLFLLIPGSILALGIAQFFMGVGIAFRAGADATLLYTLLGPEAPSRYGAALARLRFWNVSGQAVASLVGGHLYVWRPSSVFILTAVIGLLSCVPLLGMQEGRAPSHAHNYLQLVRGSLTELQSNRRVRALILLGGIGTPFFMFIFWTMQGFVRGVGGGPALGGYAVGAVWILSAASMSLSGWLGTKLRRSDHIFPVILLTLPLALYGAALSHRVKMVWFGAAALVVAASCVQLYRNAVNIRLQPFLKEETRAAITSLESSLGTLSYIVFFPFGGWLIDTLGIEQGYAVIATIIVVTMLPLLLNAQSRRLRQTTSDPPRDVVIESIDLSTAADSAGCLLNINKKPPTST